MKDAVVCPRLAYWKVGMVENQFSIQGNWLSSHVTRAFQDLCILEGAELHSGEL